MNGRQIRIFLADGTAGGMTTAEIVNWTGHVVAASRSDLPAMLKRDEVGRTGVYILLGTDTETGAEVAYIGEGDSVGKRLYQHAKDASKDFWERAIVLTSKDLNLTKAHARYLESRFITLAAKAGRVKLANSTSPDPIVLPEADRSDMEYFIGQAQIILPVLGVNLLRPTKVTSVAHQDEAFVAPAEVSPTFVIKEKKGADATGLEVDGEFIVTEGSKARPEWTGTQGSYSKLRQQLEEDGVIVPHGSEPVAIFTADHAFRSPSAAAAVLLGRNANGRTTWTTVDGATYDAWQTQQLEPGVSEDG
ncbi:GIY-YIG nuclease family protein [Aeromicrobium sp.]|uniref:GIY-YIG nuclease family protein n=1 Tax=Aeromicrobium sp. TaxID=1871063 RepID=UPI002FC938B2